MPCDHLSQCDVVFVGYLVVVAQQSGVGDLGLVNRLGPFGEVFLPLRLLLPAVVDEDRVDIVGPSGSRTDDALTLAGRTGVIAWPTALGAQYQCRCPQRVSTGSRALRSQARQ